MRKWIHARLAMVVHACNPNTRDRGKRSRHLRLLWAVWRDVDLGRKKGQGMKKEKEARFVQWHSL